LEERRDGLLGANDLARQLAQVLRASHGRVEAARILLARKRLLMRRRAAASFAPSYDPAIAAFPDRHQPPEPMRSRNEVEGRTARRAGSRTSTGALGRAPRFSRSIRPVTSCGSNRTAPPRCTAQSWPRSTSRCTVRG